MMPSTDCSAWTKKFHLTHPAEFGSFSALLFWNLMAFYLLRVLQKLIVSVSEFTMALGLKIRTSLWIYWFLQGINQPFIWLHHLWIEAGCGITIVASRKMIGRLSMQASKAVISACCSAVYATTISSITS